MNEEMIGRFDVFSAEVVDSIDLEDDTALTRRARALCGQVSSYPLMVCDDPELLGRCMVTLIEGTPQAYALMGDEAPLPTWHTLRPYVRARACAAALIRACEVIPVLEMTLVQAVILVLMYNRETGQRVDRGLIDLTDHTEGVEEDEPYEDY